MDQASGSLCATFVEYIDGARMFLESEADKDSAALQEIRLHFSDFIRHLIRTIPGKHWFTFLLYQIVHVELVCQFSGSLICSAEIDSNPPPPFENKLTPIILLEYSNNLECLFYEI